MTQPTATHPVIVIVGPTASGKTRLAILLAQRLNAEIISADSRQIYKMMDIGTAKPTPEELAAAPHHFVDFLHPREEFSAGRFSREARQRIHELRDAGKNVIVTGGSGMYISALLNGFFARTVSDKALQNRIKDRAHRKGPQVLYRELQRVDPERAAELHPNDVHRIVRALEVYHLTGEKLSALRKQPRVPADFPFAIFGLKWPREQLYARIEARIDAMLAAGWEREVRALLAAAVHPRANALLSVGYREMLQYIRGDLAYPEMVATAKQRTRNFAKRQMTWFRRDQRTRWIEIDNESALQAAANQIVQRLPTA